MDADGVVFRGYRPAPDGLPRVRTTGGTDRQALPGGGARSSRRCRRTSPARSTTSRCRPSTEITLALRDGRTVLWGSAEESGHQGRGARRRCSQPRGARSTTSACRLSRRSGAEPAISAAFWRRRPRVAAGPAPRLAYCRRQREVDITITLRLRVRVPVHAGRLPRTRPRRIPRHRIRTSRAARGDAAVAAAQNYLADHQGRRHRWRWRQRRQPDDRGRPQGRRVHRDQHRRPGAADERRRRQARHRPRADPRPRRRRQPRGRRAGRPRTTPRRSKRSSRAPTWSS